jgi:hypothetical protein
MPHDMRDYDAADRQIRKLIDKAGKLCPSCVARTLMANSAGLLAAATSTGEAINALRALADDMAGTAPEHGEPLN